MLRLGQISVVICTAVASGTMFQVEAAALSVRITTIPSKGPFRLQQTVQFSCEVEPAQSGPVTYQWRNVDYIYMVARVISVRVSTGLSILISCTIAGIFVEYH